MIDDAALLATNTVDGTVSSDWVGDVADWLGFKWGEMDPRLHLKVEGLLDVGR